jgi:hypothetical protein
VSKDRGSRDKEPEAVPIDPEAEQRELEAAAEPREFTVSAFNGSVKVVIPKDQQKAKLGKHGGEDGLE